MFTGIVKATGIVQAKKKNLIAIGINSKIVRAIPVGGSVSVDGVCLTALPRTPPRRGAWQRQRDYLTFEIMDSTLQRTTLGKLKIGAMVNVEPALRAGDSLGGHFVSGHIDDVGVVYEIKQQQQTRYIIIKISKKLSKYILAQGSVVANGVSLTVVDKKQNQFSVALTDYTLQHTNLVNLKKGDKVNIEVDIIIKYLEKLCTQ